VVAGSVGCSHSRDVGRKSRVGFSVRERWISDAAPSHLLKLDSRTVVNMRSNGGRLISRPVRFTSTRTRTRNDDGRVFPFTDDLRRLLETLRDEHQTRLRNVQLAPWVVRMVAKYRRGPLVPRRIRRFERAWKDACRLAGCRVVSFLGINGGAARI